MLIFWIIKCIFLRKSKKGADMLKIIIISLLIVLMQLNASFVESELGINIGLNSTKNKNYIKFDNPMLMLSYQNNKYVISPRADLEYVNLKDDYANSLLKGSLNGVYEYENRTYTTPYLLAGIGYELVSGVIREVFESHPFIQVGAGVRVDLDKGYKARVEGRFLKILGSDGEGNEAIITAGISMPLFLTQAKRRVPLVQKIIRQPQVLIKPQTRIIYIDKNECSIKISAPDLDRDGVIDTMDQCPATPCNFTVDRYGCPIRTTLKINFETNSATISSSSIFKIDRFANFLMNNKGSQVNIEGHTDSVGSKSNNMSLSYRRANAVVNALIERGVSSARLHAEGKGESMPIASNKTDLGKAMNRRIEAELSYPHDGR